MVDDDLELESDLGEATIVYDDPDEGTVERTVPNEHVAYVQDHWIVKTGEDDDGRDLVRRIPIQHVHYVERTVEAFEEEVQTLYDRVESFATRLGTKIPIGGGGASDGRETDDRSRDRPIDISIEEGDGGGSERR